MVFLLIWSVVGEYLFAAYSTLFIVIKIKSRCYHVRPPKYNRTLVCRPHDILIFSPTFVGRNDFRNGGGSRGGHPSGAPRPYGGGGRGRGRGSYNSRGNNERQDSGYDAPRLDSGNNDGDDGWGNNSGGGGGSTWSSGGGGGASGWSGGDGGGKSWSSGAGAKDGDGWSRGAGDAGRWSSSGGRDARAATGNSGWGSDPKRSSTQSESGNGW